MIRAGIQAIEATSFVSPRAVPQLADAAEIIGAFKDRPEVEIAALVANVKGAERAAEAGTPILVTVVSASESHNRKNVNRSIEQSIREFATIRQIAAESGAIIHGGIATSFGCPFEGNVPVEQLVHVARALRELGITHVGLGDTTGMATPPLVRERVRALKKAIPDIEITLHFHNTRAIGLANVMAGLAMGVTCFESSIGGLGGCPFAAGATGNICTEDLVYLLHECGIETGIDLEKLITVAHKVEGVLGRTLPGQVMKAGPRLRLHPVEEVQTAHG
jgi:hydroxymethylglutaryl-CoA lyase